MSTGDPVCPKHGMAPCRCFDTEFAYFDEYPKEDPFKPESIAKFACGLQLDDEDFPEPDPSTPYCGVALKGGWCKRAVGHEGDHSCS